LRADHNSLTIAVAELRKGSCFAGSLLRFSSNVFALWKGQLGQTADMTQQGRATSASSQAFVSTSAMSPKRRVALQKLFLHWW